MHEINSEMRKICRHIPFAREEAAFQGSSVVFRMDRCIGKIEFAESDYYTDSYDKLKLSVISTDSGVVDKSYLEFRYVLSDTDRIEITESGIEWVSDVNRQILTEDEYKALGEAAYRYFSVFAVNSSGDILSSASS